MGAGGAIVVAMAVLYGLTFLPALLSVLGGRVDRLRLPFLGARRDGAGAWHSMAMWVMRRPFFVLVPALAILVLAGTPFLQLRLAQGGVDQLPPSNQARQGYDTLVKDFPGQDQTTIEAVVYYPDSSPLTADHVGDVYDLSRRLASLPNVLRVESIVDIDPSLTRADYQRLYSGPSASLPAALQQAVSIGAGSHIVLLNLVTNQPPTSDEARTIVRAVRAEQVAGGQVLATGETAFDLDAVNFILGQDADRRRHGDPDHVRRPVPAHRVGRAALEGRADQPLLHLSLVRSDGVDLPAGPFEPAARVHRTVDRSERPRDPVQHRVRDVDGLRGAADQPHPGGVPAHRRQPGGGRDGAREERPLITGAAAIMVAVFLAFGLANVVLIKAIGIALAVAVAIDATIVRILIVPSIMRILGRANWWAPRPLTAFYRRIGAGESRPTGAVPARS